MKAFLSISVPNFFGLIESAELLCYLKKNLSILFVLLVHYLLLLFDEVEQSWFIPSPSPIVLTIVDLETMIV